MNPDPRVRGRLVRLGVAQAMLDAQFWFPVWFIFLLDRGFSFTEAALADGVFRIAVVLLELPMGALADRIGRKRAYVALCVLTAVMYCGIALVTSLPLLIAVWLLWALQWALASGLGPALSYDLAAEMPPVSRRTIFSRLRGASAAGVIVSLATAGALYQLHPTAPFFVSAALALGAGAIAVTLPEPEAGARASRGNLRLTLYWVRETLGGRTTRLLFIMAALYLLLTWSIQILHQPLALHVGLGINQTAIMYTACAVAGLLGTLLAARWAHERAWPAQVACGVAVGALCLGIGAWPGLAPWVFLPAISLVAALGWTLTEYSVTDSVDSRHRATALSLVSAVAGIGIAIARPALLVGAEEGGAPSAALWWGVAALALAGLIAVGALALRHRL